MVTIEKLQEIFEKTWSEETSVKWNPENHACGQSAVTALVANDVLGGEIVATQVGEDIWHFYNLFDWGRHDFTAAELTEPVEYSDALCQRDDVIDAAGFEKFKILKHTTIRYLKEFLRTLDTENK